VRICLVYDCIYPHTVGGAERWYRNLAERLAADGHEVDYLTLRQWPEGEDAGVPGVNVIAVGPQLDLYGDGGRRRIGPPLRFGLGVLGHLARQGNRYDVVHTASFPYFSLLAAGVVRPWRRFQLVVDWHEVWTRDYWGEYLGRAGAVGFAVQRLCLRLPRRSFCFSRLHERRLRELGLRGELTVLRGQYAGPPGRLIAVGEPLTVVYAGRHIPEKRVPALVPALRLARASVPELRGRILGDGPEREEVLRLVAAEGLEDAIAVPGFVTPEQVSAAIARAACLVLPSRREGYGLVVVEAAAQGTPSVVVQGHDNGAVELIEEGANGTIAASAFPDDLAAAILRVVEGGPELRKSTATWFDAHSHELALATSLETVSAAYASR
jgi:glycosyltransferase involved in cell wall biosynthesis